MSGKFNNPALRDPGKHTVLVVDDIEDNLQLLQTFLGAQGYQVLKANGGKKAIESCQAVVPHLILLDLAMPGMDGLSVLKHLRSMPGLEHTGVIIVTAETSIDDIIEGFVEGADDFVRKPYVYQELLARMRSVIKLRDLQKQLDELNHSLEDKVTAQVQELEKSRNLRRFLSPHIVDNLLKLESGTQLVSQKREISVLFLDFRQFTPFTLASEPNEVIDFLQTIYAALGPLIFKHNATLERFTGDGLMCILNAPNDVPNHADHALELSCEMMKAASEVMSELNLPESLAPALAIATGEATTGPIGFSERMDYAAIGPVTNLAARLCGIAGPYEILVAESTVNQLADFVDKVSFKEEVSLKGFYEECRVYSAQLT